MTFRLAQLRLSLSVSAIALLCLAGCDIKGEEIGNDPPSSGNSGSAQGSGGAGVGGTGGNGAQGGGGSGSGIGGEGCYGDPEAFAEAIQPQACTKNSDCCVVLNGCVNEAQVVHASNKDAAKAAWPYCDNNCTDCIPPLVTVYCLEGTCVGRAEEPTGDFPEDHCGVDEEPGTGGGNPGEHFTCGGG